MNRRNLATTVLLMFAVSVFISASLLMASTASAVGQRTPLAGLHAGMFPIGSTQMVDYCHFLNVRRGPGTSHASFTVLPRGTTITVLEFSGGWVRTDTDSGQGWIYAGYLSRDMAAAAPLVTPPATGTVTLGGRGRTPASLMSANLFPVGSTSTVEFAYMLNVRSGPGRNNRIIHVLRRGDTVTALEYQGGWIRINTPAGQGWTFAGYLGNDAVTAARAGAGIGGGTGGGGTATAPAGGVGTRTPLDQLTADRFPIGSTQTVDYCHFLNVRRGPGMAHGAFTHLRRGDTVTVLEFSNRWVRVDTPRGQGWIFSAYLRRP